VGGESTDGGSVSGEVGVTRKVWANSISSWYTLARLRNNSVDLRVDGVGAKGGPCGPRASPVKSSGLANHHNQLAHFGGDNGGDFATVTHI